MRILPEVLWRVHTKEKILYLTFDDGPIPEVTPFVLEQLSKYHAKATFFSIGENVQRHPELFNQTKMEGHTIGNHTMNHQSGWTVSAEVYQETIEACDRQIQSDNKLFRPPYGRLKPSQYRLLKDRYRLVLWDVLAYDFDVHLSGEQVAANVIGQATEGSIVVLHDSVKAFPRLKVALPAILKHFTLQGWEFGAL